MQGSTGGGILDWTGRDLLVFYTGMYGRLRYTRIVCFVTGRDGAGLFVWREETVPSGGRCFLDGEGRDVTSAAHYIDVDRRYCPSEYTGSVDSDGSKTLSWRVHLRREDGRTNT